LTKIIAYAVDSKDVALRPFEIERIDTLFLLI